MPQHLPAIPSSKKIVTPALLTAHCFCQRWAEKPHIASRPIRAEEIS
jgi:hypothetical protein